MIISSYVSLYSFEQNKYQAEMNTIVHNFSYLLKTKYKVVGKSLLNQNCVPDYSAVTDFGSVCFTNLKTKVIYIIVLHNNEIKKNELTEKISLKQENLVIVREKKIFCNKIIDPCCFLTIFAIENIHMIKNDIFKSVQPDNPRLIHNQNFTNNFAILNDDKLVNFIRNLAKDILNVIYFLYTNGYTYYHLTMDDIGVEIANNKFTFILVSIHKITKLNSNICQCCDNDTNLCYDSISIDLFCYVVLIYHVYEFLTFQNTNFTTSFENNNVYINIHKLIKNMCLDINLEDFLIQCLSIGKTTVIEVEKLKEHIFFTCDVN
ncbi:hypothetical protein COBT_001933 [Conglomerata obtusa]